jgi:hypothetical protein
MALLPVIAMCIVFWPIMAWEGPMYAAGGVIFGFMLAAFINHRRTP